MIVEISKQEYEACYRWGVARTNENATTKDKPYYEGKQDLTELQSNVLSTMTELAGVKLTGITWTEDRLDLWCPFTTKKDYSKYLGGPDIAGLIEVRRANYERSPIPIRPKDVKADAVVLQGYVPYTTTGQGTIKPEMRVEFLGWADAPEDYAKGTPASYNAETRRLNYRDRRSMQDRWLQRLLKGLATT